MIRVRSDPRGRSLLLGLSRRCTLLAKLATPRRRRPRASMSVAGEVAKCAVLDTRERGGVSNEEKDQ